MPFHLLFYLKFFTPNLFIFRFTRLVGPATWCLDMAEIYPASTFHGVDAYPVFPAEVKPLNCAFTLSNVAERLPYPDNHFDFIHQRLLIFGLTRTDWRNARTPLFSGTVSSASLLMLTKVYRR